MSAETDSRSRSGSVLSIATDSSDDTDSINERDLHRGPQYASLLEQPYQPPVASLPSKVFPRRKIGSRNRSFLEGW